MANRTRLHPKDSQRDYIVKCLWDELRKQYGNKRTRGKELRLPKKPSKKWFEKFGNI
jgi:hypothetical protein